MSDPPSSWDDDFPVDPYPHRHPPGGNFSEESLTPAQINARANTKPAVWSRAVRLDQMLRDPETGDLPADDAERNTRTAVIAERLVVDAQESAVAAADPQDQASLALSQEAGTSLTAADDQIAEAEKIPDQPYETPGGGLAPARQIIHDHQDHLVLAAEREREGDSRHRDVAYPRAVSILVGVVLFALDLGVWAQWLGLGELTSSTMLFKWVVAVVVSTLQSIAAAWAVERFAQKDRISADQRAAVADYNRTTDRRVRQGQAVGQAPDLNEVRAADQQRARTQQILIAVAAAGGILLAIRIALIAVDSGQPIAIAAVVGVVIGLLLTAVIVGLGYKFCRGNTLGDQIAAGSSILDEIDDDVRNAVENVVTARTSAQEKLNEAHKAATAADAIRASVVGDASESLLLFAAWTGAPRDLLERPRIDARELHTAIAAKQVRDELAPRLETIDAWLKHPPTGTSLALDAGSHTRALPAGDPERYRARLVPLPSRGQAGGIVSYRITTPRRPASPLVWAAAAVVTIVAAGVIAAATAAAPEGTQNTDQPLAVASEMLG
jgi:hypothetical protein